MLLHAYLHKVQGARACYKRAGCGCSGCTRHWCSCAAAPLCEVPRGHVRLRRPRRAPRRPPIRPSCLPTTAWWIVSARMQPPPPPLVEEPCSAAPWLSGARWVSRTWACVHSTYVRTQCCSVVIRGVGFSGWLRRGWAGAGQVCPHCPARASRSLSYPSTQVRHKARMGRWWCGGGEHSGRDCLVRPVKRRASRGTAAPAGTSTANSRDSR